MRVCQGDFVGEPQMLIRSQMHHLRFTRYNHIYIPACILHVLDLEHTYMEKKLYIEYIHTHTRIIYTHTSTSIHIHTQTYTYSWTITYSWTCIQTDIIEINYLLTNLQIDVTICFGSHVQHVLVCVVVWICYFHGGLAYWRVFESNRKVGDDVCLEWSIHISVVPFVFSVK